VKICRKKNKNGQLFCESSAEDSDSSSSTYSECQSGKMTCSIAVLGRVETSYRFRSKLATAVFTGIADGSIYFK
jgi:hypothetical protein